METRDSRSKIQNSGFAVVGKDNVIPDAYGDEDLGCMVYVSGWFSV